jgi:hypothetical protein
MGGINAKENTLGRMLTLAAAVLGLRRPVDLFTRKGLHSTK